MRKRLLANLSSITYQPWPTGPAHAVECVLRPAVLVHAPASTADSAVRTNECQAVAGRHERAPVVWLLCALDLLAEDIPQRPEGQPPGALNACVVNPQVPMA